MATLARRNYHSRNVRGDGSLTDWSWRNARRDNCYNTGGGGWTHAAEKRSRHRTPSLRQSISEGRHGAADGARVVVLVAACNTLLRSGSIKVRVRHVCYTCSNREGGGSIGLGTWC